MKLGVDQLAEHLGRRLVPAYVLVGDEPLQLMEAADAIRAAARGAGFCNRELFYADAGFDWGILREARDALSLFGEPRVLDLRFAAKPDKDAAAALVHYAERPPEDAILLVTTPNITQKEQKARWFQALDGLGIVVQAWPLEGEKLLRWLQRRLNDRGLLPDQSGLKLLGARVEGNLLAAAQEVEKLHILYGPGRLSDDDIVKALADSSRYDVFGLAEEVLKGQTARACRMLAGLRGEGVAAPVALWALTREVRLLLGLHAALAAGDSAAAFGARQKPPLWDSRLKLLSEAARRLDRPRLQRALLLAARADRIVKGQEPGDDWDAVLAVCACLLKAPGAAPLLLRRA